MSDTQTSEPSVQTTQPAFSVPDTYKEASLAQNIKSSDDLWGQFANAQTLIGKRPAGIPTADAPAEEWEKFYTAKGRPESADKYQFDSKIEGLPENANLTIAEQKAKEIFFKLGLTPKEAQGAWLDYLSVEIEGMNEANKAKELEKAELDKKFDEISTGLWGDKYKEVADKALAVINAAVPEQLKGAIPHIAENPEALAAMIKIIEHSEIQSNNLKAELAEVKKKYGVEDKLNSGQQTGSTSKDEVVSKLTELNMKVRGLDPFSPERKTTMSQIEELRGELARMSK